MDTVYNVLRTFTGVRQGQTPDSGSVFENREQYPYVCLEMSGQGSLTAGTQRQGISEREGEHMLKEARLI